MHTCNGQQLAAQRQLRPDQPEDARRYEGEYQQDDTPGNGA